VKKILILLFSLTLINYYSCTSSENVTEPKGDNITLILRNGMSYEAELLMVKDSMLYFISNELKVENKTYSNVITRTHINKLHEISLESYSDKGWFAYVIAANGIPAIMFSAVALSYDHPEGLLTFIPFGVNLLLYIISEPGDVEIQVPITDRKIEELNKYARYPLGLNDEQFDLLLEFYKQKEVIEIK